MRLTQVLVGKLIYELSHIWFVSFFLSFFLSFCLACHCGDFPRVQGLWRKGTNQSPSLLVFLSLNPLLFFSFFGDHLARSRSTLTWPGRRWGVGGGMWWGGASVSACAKCDC